MTSSIQTRFIGSLKFVGIINSLPNFSFQHDQTLGKYAICGLGELGRALALNGDSRSVVLEPCLALRRKLQSSIILWLE